jgi:chromate reductase
LLLAASPGPLGGLRGLIATRAILGNINVLVLPEQLAVSNAHEAFDEAGQLVDAKQAARVDGMVKKLVDTVSKLHR